MCHPSSRLSKNSLTAVPQSASHFAACGGTRGGVRNRCSTGVQRQFTDKLRQWTFKESPRSSVLLYCVCKGQARTSWRWSASRAGLPELPQVRFWTGLRTVSGLKIASRGEIGCGFQTRNGRGCLVCWIGRHDGGRFASLLALRGHWWDQCAIVAYPERMCDFGGKSLNRVILTSDHLRKLRQSADALLEVPDVHLRRHLHRLPCLRGAHCPS